MEPKYTFSLNGSDWTGEFNTRKDARSAGINAAHAERETPGVVYVGKTVPANAQSQRHAQTVVRQMSERAAQAGISKYLSGLKPEQLRDLDQVLEQAIEGWLDRNQLRPDQFAVEAISEYPVPASPAAAEHADKEISDLGPPRQVA